MTQPVTTRNMPRHRRTSGSAGVAGNERLTAMTGALLLFGFAVEGVTVLEIRQLLVLHVIVGGLLIGPVLLKISSTGYRFIRYYTGSKAYVRKGPPAPLLRLLGPLVITTSVAVLSTGILAAVAGPRSGPWLFLHKASFVLWFGVMTIHVLNYAPRLPRLLSERWDYRDTAPVRGVPMPGIPVRRAPVRDAPVRGGAVWDGPVRRAPVRDAPVWDGPVRRAPVRDAPVRGGAVWGGSVRGVPVHGGPGAGGPGAGGPVRGGPVPGGPMRGGPVRGGSVPGGPVRGGPVPGGPVRGGPMHGGPVHGGPVHGGPVRGGPMHGGPVRGGPGADGPVRGGPVRDVPVRGGPVAGGPIPGGPARWLGLVISLAIGIAVAAVAMQLSAKWGISL